MKQKLNVSNQQFIQAMKIAEKYKMSPEYVEEQIRSAMSYNKFDIGEATILLNITDRLELNRGSQAKLMQDLFRPMMNESADAETEETGVLGENEDII